MNIHKLEEALIEYCSPTLAGIKTASLFSYEYSDKKIMMAEVRAVNHKFVKKGIYLIPVMGEKNRFLLYVYRPRLLEQDLKNDEISALLSAIGYEVDNPCTCVRYLRDRFEGMKCNQEFPHEIGAFLGYPPEDVKGFIRNKGEYYKCVGNWKVYGDEKEALNMFKKYKKCTMDYVARYKTGNSLESLVVSA